MSRAAVAVVGCLALSACSLDLHMPDPPGPGSVSGRVVLAEAGSADKRPLGGVEIRILGSGLATTTTPGGTFVMENVELTSGLLLVRVEVAGVVRQRVIQLSDFGTGPQKKVNLGDIVIGENARVRGKALRSDVLPARGGHAGTTVFVPAGPFTAFTNDDGSYAFDQMPEGPVELFIFRAGYEAASLGELRLRSGETVELRDVELHLSTTQAPGSVRGALAFLPEATGKGDSAVRLVSSEGTVNVPVAEDLTFRGADVPVGLYRVVATRSGYSALDVINVLVTSGRETYFGTLTLTTAPAFDAGPPPTPQDSGTPDAGTPDAGTPDAGTPADGGVICAQQNDCSQGYWCDVNHCVPLCVGNPECGFGRVCDLTNRTCVQSCVGQCPPGSVCNAQNMCQPICDATFPCPSGKKCSAGQCVPECSTTPDCNSPFLICDLGICKRNGACVSDLDCLRSELCITGQCASRPTTASLRPDGGTWTDGGLVYSCAQPCHCKVGERCFDGFCDPDVVPTRYVARDAGGGGLTAGAPTGDLYAAVDGGGVVATLANETWDLGTVTLNLPSNTHLAGGFTACGANRWVRGTTSRTVLTGVGVNLTGQGVLASYGTQSAPRANVSMSGILLRVTGAARCGQSVGAFRYVNGLTLEDVDGDLQLGTCFASGRSLPFDIADSTNVLVRRAALVGIVSGGSTSVGFLHIARSAGTFEDLTTPDLSVSQEYLGIELDAPTSTTVVRRVTLGRYASGTSSNTYQLYVHDCAETPVTVQDVDAKWQISNSTNVGGGFVHAFQDCNQLTVQRLRSNGAGHSGVLYNSNYGLWLNNSGGLVEDIDIIIPTTGAPVANTHGVRISGPRATFNVNRVSVKANGSSGRDSNGYGVQGIRIDNAVNQGPLTIRQANIYVRGNISPHGIVVFSGSLGAQVSVVDSVIDIEGNNTCSADVLGIINLTGVVRLERNLISAGMGAFVSGIYTSGNTAQTEVYGNSVRLGYSGGTISSCPSRGSNNVVGGHAIDVSGLGTIRVIGNTFDPGGQTGQPGMTVGIGTMPGSASLVSSNIFLSGRGTDARFLSATDNTSNHGFNFANVTNNVFINTYASNVSARELLYDGGTLLNGGAGLGNTFSGTTSCFAPAAALPDGGVGFAYYLNAASPCTDKGALGSRQDGSPVSLDLFGRTRDGGAGPDVGAVEGP